MKEESGLKLPKRKRNPDDGELDITPMIGLLGTLLGMMKAFAKLAVGGASVDVSKLALDIQFALITTALGLAIAIPLVLGTAYINVQIKKMEDLVGYGLNQFLEIFKEANIRFPNK